MPENLIRQLRAAKALTQAQLAEAAGTSQQQIQRIEAGVQVARFDLAVRICGALGAEMPEVFPSTELPLQRIKKGRGRKAANAQAELRDQLEQAGIDMDPEAWTVQIRIRGGAEFNLPVSSHDKSRIWSLIQNDDPDGFIVFDSGARRYAINPNHVFTCHFLFDPVSLKPEETDEELNFELNFFLSDRNDPLKFRVDPDDTDLSMEEGDGLQVQIQDLFFNAELSIDGRLHFTDDDGETIFIRAADVSMFSAPLLVVCPSLWEAEMEDEDEAGRSAS